MLRRVVRGAAAVGVAVVAMVAGLAATVATATVTDAPVLLIGCGLVVEFLVAGGGPAGVAAVDPANAHGGRRQRGGRDGGVLVRGDGPATRRATRAPAVPDQAFW